MKERGDRRWSGWMVLVVAALGVACSRLVGGFLLPLDGDSRQMIGAIAAVLLAGVLAYGVYRFVRL